MAESRRAFYELLNYADPKIQRRLRELLDSLQFKNEAAVSSSGGVAASSLLQGSTMGPYLISNVTTDRTVDADSTTVNELADLLGTLINDLRTRGVIS